MSQRLAIKQFCLFAIHGSALFALGCGKIDQTIARRGIATAAVPAPTVMLKNTLLASSSGTPTVEITGLESGDTVQLFSDSTCSTLVASGTASGTTVDLTSSNLGVDGRYQLHSKRSNLRGSSSCSSSYAEYFKDSTLSTISMASSNKVVTEGSGLQTITVNVTPTKPYPLTVYYNTVGTNISSFLHNMVPSSVTIPANTASADITVTIANDPDSLGAKNLQVNLSDVNLTTAAPNANYRHNLIVRDDETVSPVYSLIDTSTSVHTCSITSTGTLKCWGNNVYSQLGDGTTTSRLLPYVISGGASGPTYLKVSGGQIHTCGIASDNSLRCWGSNFNNQLGDGTTTKRATPLVIDSGTSYSEVSAGSDYSCAITTAGVLKCWGANTNGKLGDGTIVQKAIPTIIDSGVAYSKISVFAAHTCGIVVGTGELKCWGSNSDGQLGAGTAKSESVPIVVDSGVHTPRFRWEQTTHAV